MATLVAVLIGVIAGLRALTAPACVSWASRLGWLHLENTGLGWLGSAAAAYTFTALALMELIADQLPQAPSRNAPAGFIARMVTGALSGAAVGAASQSPLVGLAGGLIGSLIGTLGGYEFRVRLVKAIGGKDLPIALLEDALAVGGALLIVSR
jgi:uncharacterized membrane protein